MPGGINEGLEQIYGITEWLHDWRRPPAAIPRPHGFLVAEPRPLTWRGSWTLYYARKVGIPTDKAARRLQKALEAKASDYYGLKDTNAIAYQHVALLRPARKPRHVRVDERLEAWLVADRVARPARGLHGWNSFLITLRTRGPCRSGYWFPNYYGPQRFGVCRPNTHLIGLHLARGDEQAAIRELNKPHPLDQRPRRERLTPFIRRIAMHALQAYIWNKSLARTLRESRDLQTQWRATPSCPRVSGEWRAPALPLPAPQRRGPAWWDRLVDEVLADVGLDRGMLRGLQPRLRPALMRPCTARCRPARGGLEHLFTLPRGVYATVYLREAYTMDWASECARPGSTQ